MPMDLKIDFPPRATIGQPVSVKIVVGITEAMDSEGKERANGSVPMKYAGVRLSAIRPCERPLVIEQREILCNGSFEPGEYIRDVSIALPTTVIPTSPQRGVRYKMEAFARMPGEGAAPGQPASPDEDLEFFDAGEIVLGEEHNKNKILDVNPVVLAIKGLKLNLQKDIYRPGETIKITFEAKDIKELKVIIYQRSNILCNCTQYGRICTQVPKIPPSAAGAAKTGNPTTGFMLLQVPKAAELSTRHEWEPKDKTTWNDKFGDLNEWYLAINGTRYNGEAITFDIPIEIDEGRVSTEKPVAESFFETTSTPVEDRGQAPPIPFQMKKIALVGIEPRGENEINIKLANQGTTAFHGVTCKVTGIRDTFFETKPWMAGIAAFEPGTTITVGVVKLAKGVTEVALDLVSNEGRLATFKSNIHVN